MQNSTGVIIALVAVVGLLVGFFIGMEYKSAQVKDSLESITGIATEAMDDAQMKARDSRRKSDLRLLATAVELYYADNGNYPVVGGIDALVSEVIREGYIDDFVRDPQSPSKGYCYGVSDNGWYYRLGAQLENKSDSSMVADEGGRDDWYEAGSALGKNLNEVSSCK